MFSGIIEHRAKIISKEGGIFRVENLFHDESLELGQSIAHDGACMTLTKISDNFYEFFVMEESLRVTNLGEKKSGDYFNVERCIRLSDRIDGHIVSGHIDIVGKVILQDEKSDGSLMLGISYPEIYDTLIIDKGSITINGASLTIVSSEKGGFTVSLIPLTQDWTNLSLLSLGDKVNLEFDQMAKYMNKYLEKYLQDREKKL